MLSQGRISILVGCLIAIVFGLFLFGPAMQKTSAQSENIIFVPVILYQLPPQTPYLDPISGADITHTYTVSWTMTDALIYILQEATTANFSDAKEVYRGSDLLWTMPSGKHSGTFFYRVASFNEYGSSDWSNVQSVYVNPPLTPTLLSIAVPDQNHTYSVNWSSTDALIYMLQEATTANFSDAKVVYQGPGFSWTTPSVKSAGTYYYRVAAFYSYGVSLWSNVKTITIAPPQVPTLLAIDNSDGNSTYTVNWSSTNATAYWLQEATRADFTDTKMVFQGSGLSWATPSGRVPGTYYYRVAAIYSYGGSLWSNVATITIAPPPTPIQAGEVVHFKGSSKDNRLEGKVVYSEYKTSLKPDYGDTVFSQGVFAVVVMDVTNMGLESDYPSRYNSFRVKDNVGRLFDMAELDVQFAAEDQYDLPIVYEDIQPGFTKRMVFVFDVLPQSTGMHLVSLSPW